MFHCVNLDRQEIFVERAKFNLRHAFDASLRGVAVLLAAVIVAASPFRHAHAQQVTPGYLPPGEREKFIEQQTQELQSRSSGSPENDGAVETAQRASDNQPSGQSKQSFDVAVIIGNKFYQDDDVHDMAYAYRDADEMRELLIENYGFKPEKIIWLKDTGQAEMRAIFGTRNTIRGRIWRTIDPKGRSRLFVYYSGHGTYDIELQAPHILPVDTKPADIAVSGYPLSLLYSNLSKLPVQDIFVMLEASFSGHSQNGMLIKNAQPANVSARIPKSIKAGNLTVMTAADGKQYANLDSGLRHGMFTSYLLSGLKGAADADKDGRITARELHQHVDAGVTGEAKRSLEREQTPKLFGDADFIIGDYRKNHVRMATAAEPDASGAVATTARIPDSVKPDGSGETGSQTELEYWSKVRGSQNITGLEGYLERFPEGKYRNNAIQQIQNIKKQYASLNEEDAKKRLDKRDELLAINKKLQKTLKDAGCYSGKIDGVWGRKSQAALKRFADRLDKDLNTLEPTEANLKFTISQSKGRVCPVERRRFKRETQEDYYDQDDEDRYVEYGQEEPVIEIEPEEEPEEGEDEKTLCWSNKNRIISCDNPEATYR